MSARKQHLEVLRKEYGRGCRTCGRNRNPNVQRLVNGKLPVRVAADFSSIVMFHSGQTLSLLRARSPT